MLYPFNSHQTNGPDILTNYTFVKRANARRAVAIEGRFTISFPELPDVHRSGLHRAYEIRKVRNIQVKIDSKFGSLNTSNELRPRAICLAEVWTPS
jgi:hypothetical protein